MRAFAAIAMLMLGTGPSVTAQVAGIFEAQLDPDPPEAGARFGGPVDVDAETAVVGAHHEDAASLDSGQVYVFTKDGTWSTDPTPLASLLPAPLPEGTHFGVSVAVANGVIAVGAQTDGTGTLQGSVFVFVKDEAGSWMYLEELTAGSLANDLDEFGYGVATDGTRIVVGSIKEEDVTGDTNLGGVHVFLRDEAGTWSDPTDDTFASEQVLFAGDAVSGDEFGTSVAVEGETILVGAEYAASSGKGYVFERLGGSSPWVQVADLVPPDGDADDLCGRHV